MYEYEFVRIDLEVKLTEMKPKKDYHDVIEKYAKQGWRFVQIFAPAIAGAGYAKYFELVFEREKK